MNNSHVCDYITNKISEKQKMLSELLTEKELLKEKEALIDLEIKSEEGLLAEFRDRLNKLPDHMESVKANIPISNDSNYLSASKALTLNIFGDFDDSDGLLSREITEIYAKKGIKTYEREVNEHIQELINENKVYQVNPGKQRNRKFRKREDVEHNLDLDEILS